VSACCEVRVGAVRVRDVSGLLRPRSVFFLRRRHHISSAKVHVTDTQGSSPRELVPGPREPSPAPPIHKSPPPRDGSTSSFQATAATRQLSSPATSSLRARHSQTAFQPDLPIPTSPPPESGIQVSRPMESSAGSTIPRLRTERRTSQLCFGGV